jgi:hypothetical protein
MANNTLQYTLERLNYGTTSLPQIASGQLNSNLQQIFINSAIDITHAAVGSAKPEISFTTSMIKTILGITGITGGVIDGTNNLIMWFSLLNATAARTTAFKATAAAGLLIPVSLTASKGQPALINCLGVLVSSDGTTSPVTVASGQAVTPLETWTKDAYALSAVSLDGTAMPDADNVTINFGITVDDIMGDVYRIAASILSRTPSISISGSDLALPAGMAVDGKITAADTTITLSPMADASPRAGTNIVLTVSKGAVRWDSVSGSPGARAAMGLVITPLNDGTHDPISISGV